MYSHDCMLTVMFDFKSKGTEITYLGGTEFIPILYKVYLFT